MATPSAWAYSPVTVPEGQAPPTTPPSAWAYAPVTVPAAQAPAAGAPSAWAYMPVTVPGPGLPPRRVWNPTSQTWTPRRTRRWIHATSTWEAP